MDLVVQKRQHTTVVQNGPFTLTIDAGQEFGRLGLPEGAAHCIKAGKQDTAVKDAGGKFGENTGRVVAA